MGDWRRAIVKADDLGATERHVALTLAEFMDRYGAGAWPSRATLAVACRRSVKTIGRSLQAIEAAGYVYVERRVGHVSRFSAVVPEGGDVVPLPVGNPGHQRPRSPETPVTRTLAPRTRGPLHPGHPDPTTQAATQSVIQSAAAVDDEVFQKTVELAEAKNADHPDALARRIFAEDVEPVLAEHGRPGALDYLDERISAERDREARRSRGHYRAEAEHGEAGLAERW